MGTRGCRLGGMWKAGLLAAGLMMAGPMRAQEARVAIPCPVMLVSGHVRGGSIELSFRNKGKVPLQQVSLGCSPAMAGRPRDAICHMESGLFYPGRPTRWNLRTRVRGVVR